VRRLTIADLVTIARHVRKHVADQQIEQTLMSASTHLQNGKAERAQQMIAAAKSLLRAAELAIDGQAQQFYMGLTKGLLGHESADAIDGVLIASAGDHTRVAAALNGIAGGIAALRVETERLTEALAGIEGGDSTETPLPQEGNERFTIVYQDRASIRTLHDLSNESKKLYDVLEVSGRLAGNGTGTPHLIRRIEPGSIHIDLETCKDVALTLAALWAAGNGIAMFRLSREKSRLDVRASQRKDYAEIEDLMRKGDLKEEADRVHAATNQLLHDQASSILDPESLRDMVSGRLADVVELIARGARMLGKGMVDPNTRALLEAENAAIDQLADAIELRLPTTTDQSQEDGPREPEA
jgi:hypothetical protein